MKKIKIICISLCCLLLFCSCGSGQSTSTTVLDFTTLPDGEMDISNLSLEHGELLSVIHNGDIVVVKAKITSSYSNKATIDQNYYNISKLIKENGFNTCKELQYWAIADMANAEEAKCISFTLDEDTISAIFDGNIVENQIGDYATDLWILPSLK